MKINLIIFIVLICAINIQGITMENKLYHHFPDGKFRNPEGSPERKENVNWSFRTFNKEKKKLDMSLPSDHSIKKEVVLKNLMKNQNNDFLYMVQMINPH